MPSLQEDQYNASFGEVVQLFQLDASSLGDGVYYFTPSAKPGEPPITFQGISYLPVDIAIDGFEVSSRGALPTPTVRIANVTRAMTALINDLQDDLVGCTVTRIRTLSKYLDDQPDADPTAMFPPDIYVIAQKTAETKLYVEFQLKAAIDVAGQKLPRRQILRKYCARIYRRWDEHNGRFDYTKASCPYTGTQYFDREGNATTPENDMCSKDPDGCRKRFFPSPLPGWFFPGAGKFGANG